MRGNAPAVKIAAHQAAGQFSSPPSSDGPLAFSVPDACRHLSIGRTTLFELLAAGELRSFKIKKRRLIEAESMRSFVTARIAAENVA